MEEGSRNKKTIFVGGLSADVDQTTLIETFSTFGDVIDVQLPSAQDKGKPGASAILRKTQCGQDGPHAGLVMLSFEPR